MNIYRIAMITAVVSMVCVGPSSALFEDKKLQESLKAAEEKLASSEAAYQKLSGETEALKQEVKALSDKCADLTAKNDALDQDRKNLMEQTRTLMGETGKSKDAEDALTQAKAQNTWLKNKMAQLTSQLSEMGDDLDHTSSDKERLEKEVERYKSGLEKAMREEEFKKMKAELADLKESEAEMRAELTRARNSASTAVSKMRKTDKDNARFQKDLEKYKKLYTEADNKNDALAGEMRDLPKKFSELARQNKRLIKETSDMHYNLGVFYVKGNEFARARAEFEKAVEISPDDAAAHFNLGYIYAEQLVDRKKAIDHFQDYLRLSKSDDDGVDWAKKYVLTWQTLEGRQPVK